VRWIPLVLCVGAVVAAPARAQDDFWQAEVAAAERSLLRGSLAEAEAAFDEILAAFEEEPEEDRPSLVEVRRARQGLLELELIQGHYDEVREQIGELAEGERGDRGYRVLMARALQRVGEYESAGRIWQALLDKDGSDAQAGYWRGRLWRELGAPEEARKLWRAIADAAQKGEPSPLQLAYAGRCLVELGARADVEAASELLARAVRAAPERPEARTAFGLLKHRVYNEAAGFPSGERDLLKVIEQNGENEEALVGLYQLRRSNFQLDPAKTEGFLRRALLINPRSVPALTQRGIVMLRDRRFDVGVRLRFRTGRGL